MRFVGNEKVLDTLDILGLQLCSTLHLTFMSDAILNVKSLRSQLCFPKIPMAFSKVRCRRKLTPFLINSHTQHDWTWCD